MLKVLRATTISKFAQQHAFEQHLGGVPTAYKELTALTVAAQAH